MANAADAPPDKTTSEEGDLEKWEQCENGPTGAPYRTTDPTGSACVDWITGNLTLGANNYAEGDYVLRRARLTKVPVGTNEFVMNYDARVDYKWAYDYLGVVTTTPNASVKSTVITKGAGGSDTVKNRTDVATITFDVTTAGNVTLYIPVHIASELEHGAGTGAGSLTGSNYHTRAVSLNGRDLGKRDLQMQSGAVKAANVTVTKVATPADGTDFGFGITSVNASGSFTLDVDDDATHSHTATYRVAPGAVTVTEAAAPGWTLAEIACVSTGATPTTSRETRTASFTVVHEDDVTCTFTNAKSPASVKVLKKWEVNGEAVQGTPQGYSATLTLDGVAKLFGTEYDGYRLGDSVTVGEKDVVVPAGCRNEASGAGSKSLTQAGLNTFTITNTVTCEASVKVLKSWVVNGEAVQGTPEGYSATLTLNGAEKSFGTEYGGYRLGDSVLVGEKDVVVPAGCRNEASGAGSKSLTQAGLNTFTIVNKVTCGASVRVDKVWVINDKPVEGTPEGYSATLTLNGAEKSFGTEYGGYTKGDSVTIGETNVGVPDGCKPVPSEDIGTKTLTKTGLNTFTITNKVTCEASVKVLKSWVINDKPVEGTPNGYSATLTLDDVAKSFGTEYGGYRPGASVSVGEKDVVVPAGCRNEASGIGQKSLTNPGLNTFTIVNKVICGASVRVDKVWIINDKLVDGAPPSGYSATLTLSGNEGTDSFGTTYGGYKPGEKVTVGETDVKVPERCTNTSGGDIGEHTLSTGLNEFAIVNKVTCQAPPPPPPPPAPGSVRVEKLDAVTGALIDTAKFKLWRDSGTTVGAVDAGDILVAPGEVSTGTSGNAAGTYGWTGLSQGAYILEETVAPQGYLLSQPATQAFTLGSGTTVTKQFRNPQSPTSVEVLKQDDETGEVLEGAEFQAYADNGSTPGVLDSGDTRIGAPVLTDARGVARWTGLLFGRYLFEEVAAPEGYGLPEETVQSVTLDARNAGGTIRLVFLDPGQGTLKVTKAAFELVRGEWVESDGVVEFGDQVKYVVTLTADGPKIHHDVVVSDYIPGNDPDDTTSDTEGIYVAGTAVCVEAGECTVTFDSAEQLLTWELGDVRDEARSVEFVIRFPQPADDASTADGVYSETLANTAAASWTDRNGDQEVDSNEVVVDAELVIAPAEEEVPPAKPRPPAEILPETGAQAGLGLWTTLGGLMLVLGAALLSWRRRQLS